MPTPQQWLERGLGALNAGDYRATEHAARQVLAEQLDHPLALLLLGISQHHLGHADALLTLKRAVAAAPGDAQFQYNYAVTLTECGHTDLAMVAYRACLDIDPDFRDALWNYGELLRLAEHFTHALACFDRVVRLEGFKRGKLAHRMAVCCAHIPSEYARADDLFRAQIAADDDPHTHWEYARHLLAQGRDDAAWPHYARRFEAGHKISVSRTEFSWPAWEGQYQSDLTLLVHDEQGAGDAILFAAFVPELLTRAQAAGMAVVLTCRPALARLFAASFPRARVFAHDPGQGDAALRQTLPAHTQVIAIGDLPLHLPHPAPGAWLKPAPEDQARMRAFVADTAQGIRKIGLVWQSNPTVTSANRRARDVPSRLFNDWAAVLGGVRWFALQIDEHRAALADMVDLPITDCAAEVTDFSLTAALMQQMDCVVSVCTFAANLAGALGLDTRVLLQKHADWRWRGIRDAGDEGETESDEGAGTAWFPRITPYRQRLAGDWSSPLRRLIEDLQKPVLQPASCRPRKADLTPREPP